MTSIISASLFTVTVRARSAQGGVTEEAATFDTGPASAAAAQAERAAAARERHLELEELNR